MEKTVNKVVASLAFVLALMVGVYATGLTKPVKAEDGDGKVDSSAEEKDASEETKTTGTNISITPVSKILQLDKSSSYEDKFDITNGGSEPVKFEVYAAPYSYFYSEEKRISL